MFQNKKEPVADSIYLINCSLYGKINRDENLPLISSFMGRLLVSSFFSLKVKLFVMFQFFTEVSHVGNNVKLRHMYVTSDNNGLKECVSTRVYLVKQGMSCLLLWQEMQKGSPKKMRLIFLSEISKWGFPSLGHACVFLLILTDVDSSSEKSEGKFI